MMKEQRELFVQLAARILEGMKEIAVSAQDKAAMRAHAVRDNPPYIGGEFRMPEAPHKKRYFHLMPTAEDLLDIEKSASEVVENIRKEREVGVDG